MKVYTKTGDKGKTSLFGGARVVKHNIRIQTYGMADELNSHIGLVRDLVNDVSVSEQLGSVQDSLFVIGSNLAKDPSNKKVQVPAFPEEETRNLETWIDEMEQGLSPLKAFILPGGHVSVSHTHITRCVCRRLERQLSELIQEEESDEIFIVFLQYINRLSDYLFVLSRKIAKDLGVKETEWHPKK